MSKLSKRKFAITGTIGSGKSTLTKIIAKSYPTISADEIVANMYLDKDFAKMINKQFLDNENETVNKADLSKVIFSDAQKKQDLEAIIHPLVKKEIIQWLNIQKGLCFTEVPLLFEANLQDLFDGVILVVAQNEKIVERLEVSRNQSRKKTLSIIAKQMDVKTKIEKSDIVIENNEGLKQLKEKIENLLIKLESGE